MIYISIDFSLNSTGITIFHDGEFHFLSYFNEESATKSQMKNIYELDRVNNFLLRLYRRSPITAPNNRQDGLCGWQREHLMNCLYYGEDLKDFIVISLLKLFGNFDKSEVVVVIENYSYSSQSNTLIQMVENTMSLKSHLIDSVCDIDNFYIVPAPVVKSFVGKGSFDKYDMLEAFMKRGDGGDFHSFLLENKNIFIKSRIKKGKEFNEVLSPIQDIIDSYWLLVYLLHSQNILK